MCGCVSSSWVWLGVAGEDGMGKINWREEGDLNNNRITDRDIQDLCQGKAEKLQSTCGGGVRGGIIIVVSWATVYK